jgi:hypothetical protein
MDAHAIPRVAEVREIAAAIVFAAGPNAFLTGSVVDVNDSPRECCGGIRRNNGLKVGA